MHGIRELIESTKLGSQFKYLGPATENAKSTTLFMHGTTRAKVGLSVDSCSNCSDLGAEPSLPVDFDVLSTTQHILNWIHGF